MMIEVVNWPRFQHFKKRDPIFIKLYRELRHKWEWRCLSPTSSKALIDLWLVASEQSHPGQIDLEIGQLAWELSLTISESESALQELASQGFITMISGGYQDDIPRALARDRDRDREERVPTVPVEVGDLWDLWLCEFGGNPPHPKLTATRSKKLRAFAEEHLYDRPDPLEAFKAVLRAVKGSEHHMSQRAYQMPESLFRNPERRDTWVQRSTNGSSASGALSRPRL